MKKENNKVMVEMLTFEEPEWRLCEKSIMLQHFLPQAYFFATSLKLFQNKVSKIWKLSETEKM